ncbi:Uncharacterized protein SCF082_LOCUS40646 [Durusdinium trenchii]|uniref:Uncharacterized protein n=1 Tax=Durusdinium trenchii TaxID=1381693 RepID=A0ABP0QAJ2_9DINO
MKEIKLTQDLMQLFIKYQIPSDLLSYSDDLLLPGESATAEKRLQLVKGQVEAGRRHESDDRSRASWLCIGLLLRFRGDETLLTAKWTQHL